jgi:hypothetical protein
MPAANPLSRHSVRQLQARDMNGCATRFVKWWDEMRTERLGLLRDGSSTSTHRSYHLSPRELSAIASTVVPDRTIKTKPVARAISYGMALSWLPYLTRTSGRPSSSGASSAGSSLFDQPTKEETNLSGSRYHPYIKYQVRLPCELPGGIPTRMTRPSGVVSHA